MGIACSMLPCKDAADARTLVRICQLYNSPYIHHSYSIAHVLDDAQS